MTTHDSRSWSYDRSFSVRVFDVLVRWFVALLDMSASLSVRLGLTDFGSVAFAAKPVVAPRRTLAPASLPTTVAVPSWAGSLPSLDTPAAAQAA